MPKSTYSSVQYKPFVLRRLTDYDRTAFTDPCQQKGGEGSLISRKQLRDDILESVTMLFNSRSHPRERDLMKYPQLASSVLAYGISDCCGKNSSDAEIEGLRRHIVTQLQYFESRLDPDSIKVELVQSDDGHKTQLNFKVAALIRVGEVSEELLFLSKLDLETGCSELEKL